MEGKEKQEEKEETTQHNGQVETMGSNPKLLPNEKQYSIFDIPGIDSILHDRHFSQGRGFFFSIIF